MKGAPKREFPLHFAKGKKLFNIIVKMSDTPGSMSAILDALGKKVNLIGTASYTLGDGTALFTAFAESLTPQDTPASLKGVVAKLGAVLEVEVSEGKDGLIVDTFHTGVKVGNDDYILMRREGLSGVFDHIVKLFGTGGEVLLYEEGKALGHDNSARRVGELGEEVVVNEAAYLGRALTAQGWGTLESTSRPELKEFSVTVEGCFECSGGGKLRKGCDFLRGFFEGSATVTRGVKVKVEEVECRLRGDRSCVFRIGL